MKNYDLTKENERQKFYKCTKWRKLRAYKLDLNPLCEHCDKKGIITTGTEIDHIIPIVQWIKGALRLDNLQTLCGSCHTKKGNEEGKAPTILANRKWNI